MQFQRFLGERALAAVFTRLEPYGFWVMVYFRDKSLLYFSSKSGLSKAKIDIGMGRNWPRSSACHMCPGSATTSESNKKQRGLYWITCIFSESLLNLLSSQHITCLIWPNYKSERGVFICAHFAESPCIFNLTLCLLSRCSFIILSCNALKVI